MSSIPLAWLQLKKDRLRFLVAIGGVSFAVMLVFMQLGFRDALFDSATRMHSLFRYDLAMISPKTPTLISPKELSRRRVAQVRGIEGVRSAEPVYMGYTNWKNPEEPNRRRPLFMIGFDPAVAVIDVPAIDENRHLLTRPDVAFFDEDSRREYGPVKDILARDGVLSVELEGRDVDIIGLFKLGTSFGIDANLIVSDLNFLRIRDDVARGDAGLGLIHLEEGQDVNEVRERIARNIPPDAILLTRKEFIDREIDYWNSSTPVGFVFDVGSLIGLIVGAIIVYQILFADVSDHMQEYATLKAMGYSNRSLSSIVIKQAIILAIMGFIVGGFIAIGVYRLTSSATNLPMGMTPTRAGIVLGLTMGMCTLSALIAMRKVRTTDPADVF